MTCMYPPPHMTCMYPPPHSSRPHPWKHTHTTHTHTQKHTRTAAPSTGSLIEHRKKTKTLVNLLVSQNVSENEIRAKGCEKQGVGRKRLA
jgi:hypothetical protein